MKLVLDIQTVAAPGVENSFYPSWAMKRGSKTMEDAMNRAGVHPEFGFICGAAILPTIDDGSYDVKDIEVKTAGSVQEEDELLEWMLGRVAAFDPNMNKQSASIVPVGHNITNFDIPYLTKRLMAHGYCIPKFLKKAINGNTVDVMKLLTCGGGTTMSLRSAAYMFGIDDPLTEDGPQSVYDMFRDGRLSDIAELARINVRVAADVYKALVDSQFV